MTPAGRAVFLVCKLERFDGKTSRSTSADEMIAELHYLDVRGSPATRYLRDFLRRPGRPPSREHAKWAEEFRRQRQLNDDFDDSTLSTARGH
jgi:hypothetical protein